ncbi:Uncharacterised protein [Enterobacter cancerogenus]|uniref:Uncharacterized protein n=1 Tax=Enterobacter cancerogenus TaxID=69218 RepID=A0A484XEU6_9ENTR|nr:Uncharacterised protein [Enterobacter cancerogenus]
MRVEFHPFLIGIRKRFYISQRISLILCDFYVILSYPYTELAESGTVYLHDINPNQTGITKGL